MLVKLAKKIAERLGWMLVPIEEWTLWAIRAEQAWTVGERAQEVTRSAERLVEENKQLRAAYDALLEEFEELAHG